MFETIPFAGNRIDRAERHRRDPSWLAARLADPTSRFLPFHDLRPLIGFDAARGAGFAWQSVASVAEALANGNETILLGDDEGCRFAVDVGPLADPGAFAEVSGGKFIDARSIASSLAPDLSGLLAQARSLLDWHANHRFCPACGAATTSHGGGRERRCVADECGRPQFPRNEPVVIMQIVRGRRCLLGRQHRFAPGMWSCLAGFVEPGETIEAAVRRETFEEAGVHVGAVRYVGSQPWPFPASLMLGCIAEAEGDALDVDANELEDARWFDRDEIAAMLARAETDAAPRLPGPVAIAHHLTRYWLERG